MRHVPAGIKGSRPAREYVAARARAGCRGLYESYLRHAAFKVIQDRLVSDIRIGDPEAVRNSVLTSNTASAARRVVQQGKEAMSWAWRYNAGISGLDAFAYEWWLRWSIETPRARGSTYP
ncbi:hypothetical protein [Methylobacterium nonmethylotrophicum]|uniref:Uncharacterized protein n=1 Tax=Methylobacterium nonmethylotrophicum TaxID=1141884 RepID=A0A4Z0NNV1_9HYPH|nr:hypothetical protein [Methylobacterium nonmethylotrophicum]TGD98375.1 hypothetical protein EU555_16885 [Methylobacterium nonmethylotrophicum]